jgi:hypothetical protein
MFPVQNGSSWFDPFISKLNRSSTLTIQLANVAPPSTGDDRFAQRSEKQLP